MFTEDSFFHFEIWGQLPYLIHHRFRMGTKGQLYASTDTGLFTNTDFQRISLKRLKMSMTSFQVNKVLLSHLGIPLKLNMFIQSIGQVSLVDRRGQWDFNHCSLYSQIASPLTVAMGARFQKAIQKAESQEHTWQWKARRFTRTRRAHGSSCRPMTN